MRYSFGILSIVAYVAFNSFTIKTASNSNTEILLDDTTKPKAIAPMGYKPFLGCSPTIDGGVHDKNTILELLKYPICVRDKNGQMYSVKEFLLTYSERGVFQDSTGLPVLVTDYTTVQIDSSQVAENVLKSLTERLYKGDTLTFSDVYIDRNGIPMNINKSMKVVVR